MVLEDGPAYTPEQVSANWWMGDMTPDAIRKAAARGQIEHTRIQGRIFLTKANILANQAAGFQPAGASGPLRSVAPRRPRRSTPAETPPGVTVLSPRPEARRRSRKAS